MGKKKKLLQFRVAGIAIIYDLKTNGTGVITLVD